MDLCSYYEMFGMHQSSVTSRQSAVDSQQNLVVSRQSFVFVVRCYFVV